MKTSSHKHQIKLGIVITNKTLQEDNEKKLVALNDSSTDNGVESNPFSRFLTPTLIKYKGNKDN